MYFSNSLDLNNDLNNMFLQVPIYELRNDGRSNLLGALLIAGQFSIPEASELSGLHITCCSEWNIDMFLLSSLLYIILLVPVAFSFNL